MALQPFEWKDKPALIEHLFPVQKISAESFKEQSAVQSKTLVALGSYWKGRKPLVLNKACILGSLLPVTEDRLKDLEIFELLMGMAPEAMQRRIEENLPASKREDIGDYLVLPFNDQVRAGKRAEEVGDSLFALVWGRVNAHLGTSANSIPELVEQMGIARFGHRPKVADVFAGSGQIPFEAARLGCNVYASDLNPMACLLTWGSFNVVGAPAKSKSGLAAAQAKLVERVQQEIDELEVEVDGRGWRAKAYLYCVEVICPESGWSVPVLPTLVVSASKFVVVSLIPVESEKRYEIEVKYCNDKNEMEALDKLLQSRTRSAGFMKSLMLQRICSSFASGLKTAQKMLKHTVSDEDEDLIEDVEHVLSEMTPAEVACLREIETQLSRPEAVDSKLNTVKWFLTEFCTDGKTWLEHGSIIFSQYYDTAEWIAKELAKSLKGEVVAVYAGVGKSGLFRGEQFNNVEREVIKAAVKTREIRLVVATDAACEGLNLQTLGTLINIDLPWNPSRLEQRLGRIKRFGQSRKFVDMLNLVYTETQDEKVYNVLSDRLRDTYDIFGSLPDTIDDDWIDNEEALNARMNEYMHERKKAQDAFSVKYRGTLDPDAHLWERCATVLSRRDIVSKLSEPWGN